MYLTPSWVIIVAWVTAIFTVGYMPPWAVAAQRNMPNQAAVGVLNMLLGWTIIGWVVALVMAVSQKRA